MEQTNTSTAVPVPPIEIQRSSTGNNKDKDDDTAANDRVPEDKEKISTSDMTRRMVCGGLAGMVAKVVFLCEPFLLVRIVY